MRRGCREVLQDARGAARLMGDARLERLNREHLQELLAQPIPRNHPPLTFPGAGPDRQAALDALPATADIVEIQRVGNGWRVVDLVDGAVQTCDVDWSRRRRIFVRGVEFVLGGQIVLRGQTQSCFVANGQRARINKAGMLRFAGAAPEVPDAPPPDPKGMVGPRARPLGAPPARDPAAGGR